MCEFAEPASFRSALMPPERWFAGTFPLESGDDASSPQRHRRHAGEQRKTRLCREPYLEPT